MVKIHHNENAVSPVIGVMLMLVITIIIATVVSMSAAGIIDKASADETNAEVDFIGLYTGGYALGDTMSTTYAETGMVFKVTGSTPLDITNLRLSGSTGSGGLCGGSFAVSYNTPVAVDWMAKDNGGTASSGKIRNRITQPASSMNHRIVKFGEGWTDEEKYSNLVYPGEYFVILAEYTIISGNDTTGRYYMIGFAARNTDGSTAISGAVYSNGNTELALKDMKTGKVYYTGILTNDQTF